MTRADLSLLPLARYRKLRLHPTSTAKDARRLFRRNPRLYHLPLLSDKGQYLTLFPKRSLLRTAPDTPLSDLPQVAISPLPPYATIYDALQEMETHKVPEIPLAAEDGSYLGLITTDSLVHWWAQLGAVQERGTVIVLETHLQNYSLAEIAQILESDDIRVLSLYLLRHEADLHKTYIVLKVNSIYLARSLELLERKGYHPVKLHGDLMMEKNARDHLQALIRYLEM